MNNVFNFRTYRAGRRSVFMCEILKKLQGKSPEQLLKEYKIKLEPPINLDELMEKIGIDVRPANFADIEQKIGYKNGDILGATLVDGEDVGIFYRSDVSQNRKRFTIAHELGHCCIHASSLKETNIQLRQESEKNSLVEIDASIFAGELLIPRELLEREYDKFLLPSLRALSEIFQVSTSVMGARLDYLNMPYYKDTELCEG